MAHFVKYNLGTGAVVGVPGPAEPAYTPGVEAVRSYPTAPPAGSVWNTGSRDYDYPSVVSSVQSGASGVKVHRVKITAVWAARGRQVGTAKLPTVDPSRCVVGPLRADVSTPGATAFPSAIHAAAIVTDANTLTAAGSVEGPAGAFPCTIDFYTEVTEYP